MAPDLNQDLHNINISAIRPLVSPEEIRGEYPITEAMRQSIVEHRKTITDILHHRDPRLLVVVGPCSIHDPKSAWEYAQRLNELRKDMQDQLYIVMRMYFEKPRTTIGWKGLVNDPYLDGSCNMNLGLRIARELLVKVADLGLPSATEILDPITPQYTSNLLSWAAIGARTTESQVHREVTSGLSMPVGFKNATSGDVQVAIDAIKAARNAHSFIGINLEGRTSIVRTAGNPHCHVVLRGGTKPNYDEESVKAAAAKMEDDGVVPSIMVDCSHANSKKDYKKQPMVLEEVIRQRKAGNSPITGVMLESHINAGNQKIPTDLSRLDYGVSITDACMDWDMTESLIRNQFS